jgi:transcriptional regulator with PAS, ATPase and Fis domain
MSASARHNKPRVTRQNAHREHTIAQLRHKYGVKDLHQLFRETIDRVLRLTNGDKTLTAELLGIGKTTIYCMTRPPRYRTIPRPPSRSRVDVAREVKRLRREFGFKTQRELLRDEIRRVLKLTGGNRELSAELLEMGRTTLWRHLRMAAHNPETNIR